MKRAAVAAVLLGLIAIIAVMALRHPHRYRLVIEVEQQGTVSQGESVIAVSWWRTPDFFPGVPPYEVFVRGRSPVAHLPDGSLVLAALQPNRTITGPEEVGAENLLLNACTHTFVGNGRPTAERLRAGKRCQGRHDLTSGNMPQLVWVRDPQSVSSAVPLDPNVAMESSTPRLRAAYVIVTGDRVLSRLDEEGAWLRQLRASTGGGRGDRFNFYPWNIER